MLFSLLNQYKKSQSMAHNTTPLNWDANAAYVKHQMAVRLLNFHLLHQSKQNHCAHAFELAHKIKQALEQAERKQQFAQRHRNFDLKTALTMLQNAIKTKPSQ